MNIFYLDEDPKLAALYHNDKHCIKMVVEYGQLLSGAHRYFGDQRRQLYEQTHINHPSAIWVRTSASNYRWLYRLFIELSTQYQLRYNRRHRTTLRLLAVLREPPAKLEDTGLTPLLLAMPDIYKQENSVEAYRAYYMGDKSKIASWRNPASIPPWFKLKKE